jgi:hypothetical protein
MALAACFPALATQDPFVTLSGSRPTNNQIQLTLTGEAGVPYVIESTSDLQNFWTAVATNSDSEITRVITIPAPTNSTFYRANRRYLPLFEAALAAKESIDLRGNDITCDSFDSGDPNYSFNGQYDPTKAQDGGDVLCNGGMLLSIGNSKIKGSVRAGPGGSISFGPNGSVGDSAWVTNGNLGIQPGHFVDNVNISWPELRMPDNTWIPAPVVNAKLPGPSGTTQTFRYYLTSGNWLINDFRYNIYIDGDVLVYVPSTALVNMTGQDLLYIAPGARLLLFVNVPAVHIGGNGIANASGNALDFIYFGLPSNTNISLTINATNLATVYCPQADLTLSDRGINTNAFDFFGAMIAKSIKLNGKFNFHFDENLRREFFR